jgi:benzoyl-CoA reductase subunit B
MTADITTGPDAHNGGADAIVGRGVRDGARMFREWFAELTEAASGRRDVAYTFVMGSVAELLKSFDMPVVFPEINALQTAIRHDADSYLNEAEDYGFSPDICGYVKADIAMQLRGGEHPMGTIPKPGMAVLTNACNTYIKWAEIWERLYGIPAVVLDIPGSRAAGAQSQPGDGDFEYERAYVVGQIEELIEVCERVSGRKLDIDRLRECLGHANVMSAAWKATLEANRNDPAVFNALTDGTVYLGVANCFRGTPEGSRYFTELVEEMDHRVAHGIGALTTVDGADAPIDQRYRLGFMGVPCYPIFRRFNDLFTSQGGVFVTSAYLTFASGGTSLGYTYDLDDPIASLAEGLMMCVRGTMDGLFYSVPEIETDLSRYGLDGVVYHPIKSCRTISTGLADRRTHLTEDLGMATLYLESDMMDQRVVAEASMRNRIDAFFEGLIARSR